MKIHFFDNRETNQQSPLNLDRGHLFGDGFFTTGIIQNQKLLHDERHYQRLSISAEKLKFKSFDIHALKTEIKSYINQVEQASIRITVSRQQQTRGYAYHPDAKLNITIQLSPLADLPDDYCHLIFAQTSVSLNPSFAGIKHLNRLDSVMAASEATQPYEESLLTYQQQNEQQVICGSRTNLFAFIDGQWTTPVLDKAGVSGITRQRLIELMKLQNMTLLQTEITRSQLLSCQAAFVTNSLLGIWPVNKIENRSIATELSEDLKSKLNFTR